MGTSSAVDILVRGIIAYSTLFDLAVAYLAVAIVYSTVKRFKFSLATPLQPPW